jgi:hypothetical protein
VAETEPGGLVRPYVRDEWPPRADLGTGAAGAYPGNPEDPQAAPPGIPDGVSGERPEESTLVLSGTVPPQRAFSAPVPGPAGAAPGPAAEPAAHRRRRLTARPVALAGAGAAAVALIAWGASALVDTGHSGAPDDTASSPLAATAPAHGHATRRPASAASASPSASASAAAASASASASSSASPSASASSASPSASARHKGHGASPSGPASPGSSAANPGGAGSTSSSAPSAPTAPSAPASTPPTLYLGSYGPDVLRLQHELYNQGFTYIHFTSYYDRTTLNAVAQFQRDRGITADPSGYYGPTTRAALEGTG